MFCRANSVETSAIKSCLDLYCLWSVQKVNSSKSSILFNKNTKPQAIHSVEEIFNLKKLQFLILLNRFKKNPLKTLSPWLES